MKEHFRALGIDDAPFYRDDSHTELVGIVVRAPDLIEGFARTRVVVDGLDATEKVIELARQIKQRNLDYILLDGACCGGFNPYDMDLIHTSLDIPVITVTPTRPNAEQMQEALLNFEDWERRWDVIDQHPLSEVETPSGSIFCSFVGVGLEEVELQLRRLLKVGKTPEPLRLAHLAAGGLFPKGPSVER